MSVEPPKDPGADADSVPLLYDELASWWPLVSAPSDYAEEAAFYLRVLRDHCQGPAKTLLELGSGGGNNAMHLKAHFDHMTLVDVAPGMLEVSRSLNPECEHHVGDMRSVRLGREFDCVFVHDAICYATSLAELAQVLETAHVHCRPGGAALFAPDFVRESFQPGTEHGGGNGADRSLRYLEWTWDPDPRDSTYVVDYAFLTRAGDGSVEVRHDRHVEGLFSTPEWSQALEAAGFTAEVVPFRHSEVPRELLVFVGAKPHT